ncbi:MAG: pilin [Gammaproteobacteria bacterium]|jgi:type IV pilus assembly protein PilA
MDAMQQGFTLIELMIVVSIIGFLVTIGLPAYQDYTVRTKISEIILVADSAKTNITDYYMSAGRMPTSTVAANINTDTAQSNFIGAIAFSTTASTATITYSVANLGTTGDIALVGTASSNGLAWDCGTAATTVDTRYLPLNCRN